MSSGVMMAIAAAVVAPASVRAAPATAPRSGGTIAVAPAAASGRDPLATIATRAATAALGLRGFTILNDPAHAAYLAEVTTMRTEVGTSVARGPAGRALATGGGVNIPLAHGKDVLVPLLRTELEISIRKRGEDTVLWHGAAVTVRSATARDGGADQVGFALSQAALSSYPTQTTAPISVP